MFLELLLAGRVVLLLLGFGFWFLVFWQQAFCFCVRAGLLKVEVEGVAAGDVT